MRNRIVLNVPHSSVDGLESAGWRSTQKMVENVNTWTDWYTNLIFKPDRKLLMQDGKAVCMHVFGKSRFVVDVERLIDDEKEKDGEGIVYERYGDGLVRDVSPQEKAELYAERESFLAGIEDNIIENDRQGYGNILVDCHSFASFLADIDICVGFNDDSSRPSDKMLDGIYRIIKDSGFTYGINAPYSNSLQPVSAENLTSLRHGYATFMLEVNKKDYLVENTIDLKPDWTLLGNCINNIYSFVADYDFTE